MTKKIKGNLVMKKDTIFDESIVVEGSIKPVGREKWNLEVDGNITAKDIIVRNIKAWNINAWDINAGNIKAWNINAGDVDALNLDVRDINALDLDVRTINARDINVLDMRTWDINAEYIKANNIITTRLGNISAHSIDACNISYYAVCFALHHISCTSIKGRRHNSKHFSLDKKITMKKKSSSYNKIPIYKANIDILETLEMIKNE